jgi:uncharacterized protein
VSRSSGERILKGAKNWWFVGPGGIARLRDAHVTSEGTLQPAAERRLRESGMFRVTQIGAYSLTVLTSTYCNLGCGYCFQNTGQDLSGGTRPPRISHTRLTAETAETILRFTRQRMDAAGLSKLTIMLFGGEPLLNPRGCVELLTRAAGYGLTSASMISNTTLLTPPLARQLSELGLKTVQVTFDGDREDHDRIRVQRTKGGTFDQIVRNIQRASEVTPIRWMLRVNVSHHTHPRVSALIDRLAASLNPSRCAIYFAQVGDAGIGYTNELEQTGDVAADFAAWQRTALDYGFSVKKPRASTACAACGHRDGRFGAVVNADGTLASCWETAGRPGWEVGTISTGYLPSAQTENRWIACGDQYRSEDDAEALAAFRDTVDSAMLDYLDATGRL